MFHSKTSPAQVRAALIENQALDMRRDGYNYDEIAEKMQLPREKVNIAVRRALKRLKAETREHASEVLDLELARLDKMYYYAMMHFRAGDLKGLTVALSIMDRRTKYLGLDAAIKADFNVKTNDVDLSNLTDAQLLEMQALLQSTVAEASDDELPDDPDYDSN
jgi:hypothetical protein